jgi:hypothetical protein
MRKGPESVYDKWNIFVVIVVLLSLLITIKEQ